MQCFTDAVKTTTEFSSKCQYCDVYQLKKYCFHYVCVMCDLCLYKAVNCINIYTIHIYYKMFVWDFLSYTFKRFHSTRSMLPSILDVLHIFLSYLYN